MTIRITPIQEPANMPRDVMCHDCARKQASIVYQFHSIETLQSPVPMSIEDMSIPDMELLVAEAAAAVPVDDMATVIDDVADIDMPDIELMSIFDRRRGVSRYQVQAPTRDPEVRRGWRRAASTSKMCTAEVAVDGT